MFKRSKLENKLIKYSLKFCGAKLHNVQSKTKNYLMKRYLFACKYYEYKKNVDWNSRENELVEVQINIGQKNIHGSYCASSGGKDSAYAHELKFKHNMNPLL